MSTRDQEVHVSDFFDLVFVTRLITVRVMCFYCGVRLVQS